MTFTGFISNPIFIIMCKFGVVGCDGKGLERNLQLSLTE